nr:MAG TPA: hypothetical protein [Caudoviricetes sp.]
MIRNRFIVARYTPGRSLSPETGASPCCLPSPGAGTCT